MVEVFGRTNTSVPELWFSLIAPSSETEAEATAQAARESGAILDVSPALARWGHEFRGQDVRLLSFGGLDYERSIDETHAYDLTSAHLIETLSSLGRSEIEFFFLRVRRAVEEFQINGALGALASAKQDGLVGHVGLYVEGPALAVSGVWRFHDAFECVMARRNPRFESDFRMIEALATERRVGLVSCQPFQWGRGLSIAWLPGDPFRSSAYLASLREEHPVMLGVRSAAEIEFALEANASPQALPVDALAAFDDPATWRDCADDPRPWVRETVREAWHAPV